MPQALRSPSVFLDESIGTLSPEDRTAITLALEPTRPAISLEGGGHVAAVISAGLRALVDAVPSQMAALATQTDRLDRVSVLLPDSGLAKPSVLPSRADLTLWEVLRHVDLARADERLLRRIGAVYFQAAVSFAQPDQPTLRSILGVVESTDTQRAAMTLVAMENCTQGAWARTVSKLTKRKNSHVSAAASLAEQRIEHRLVGARSFTNASKVEGFGDDLTGDEVIRCAEYVRASAEGGNALAFLVAIAHWIGLWLWELMAIEVFGPAETGLVRISPDCTHVTFNLAGVLHDLAKQRHGEYKASCTVLIIALPRWIADWLIAMRFVRPDSRTLAELTQFRLPRTQSRIPGVPEAHARRLTVRRFVDARSAPVIDKVHQQVVAVAFVDPARAEKASFHYHAIPQLEASAAHQLRADIIKWGPLCEVTQPVGAHVGSCNTPLLSAVATLVEHRRRAMQDAPHGPNAGWNLLRAFHNRFVRYVLLMCTLAWLLRGCKEHTLPASLARLFRAMNFRDKAVPTAQCAPAPIVCGSLMRLQMQYLAMHARSMARRITRLAKACLELAPLADKFLRLAEGDPDMALLQVIEGALLRPAGAQDLGSDLDISWAADALRHFGTDGQRELGTPAEMIELMLRHAGNGFELFSSACGVSMHEWAIDAGNAQDRLLRSLNAHPLPGLSSKSSVERA